MPTSSADEKACLSACSTSGTDNRPLTQPRALEGIKVKLQSLSEHAGTTEQSEKEGDMTTVCDLADDLRDAIVEYQVSRNI